MAEFVSEVIPAPGFATGAYGTDDELLKSTARFTQKGVTLFPGQGVLPLGTVVGRQTSTKQYGKFAVGNSDGTQNASGILRNTVDTGAAGSIPTLANIVISGILDATKVSSANGTLTGIVTAFPGSRADSVLNNFTF